MKMLIRCLVIMMLITPLFAAQDLEELLRRIQSSRDKYSDHNKEDNRILTDDQLFNVMFPYELSHDVPSSKEPESSGSKRLEINEVIKPKLIQGLEPQESVISHINKQSRSDAQLEKTSSDEARLDASSVSVKPTLERDVADVEKAQSIALNSREVRIMGPDQREVEMNDDFATKFAVVFDNLKNEANVFFSDVNDKLDKGWTEFKQTVDKLVEEGKKQLRISWHDSNWVPHLNPANILDYFCQKSNPFYDRLCNNEVAKMQRLGPDQMSMMTGIEYTLLHVQEPILYVIRKQDRHGPKSTIPLVDYYILAGVVYQAPDLNSIVQSRVLNAALNLKGALDDFLDIKNFNPSSGFSWESQKSGPSVLQSESQRRNEEFTRFQYKVGPLLKNFSESNQ